VNIPGTSASLHGPLSVALDKSGHVYFTDYNDVLRLDPTTGTLTLVAGTGTCGFSGDNGPATAAQLCEPAGIALDSAGNLYIADGGNHLIRKVFNGVITTFAGGGTSLGDNEPATAAQLENPAALAADLSGGLYIADAGNYRVRKVSSSGVITTVAGDGTQGFSGDGGPATSAQLGLPSGVAVDSAGNLYIDDETNDRVREVSNGVITTVAGSGGAECVLTGPATGTALGLPSGVAVDSAGNLYIADTECRLVRKIANGVTSVVAGNPAATALGDGGPATSAEVDPLAVAVDSAGSVYIADAHRIREVANGVINTIAGNGTPGYSGDGGLSTNAQLSSPTGVAVDSNGNVYIADSYSNHIRKVSGGVITTVAGNGGEGFSGDNGPATSAMLNQPRGVAVDSAGSVYVADTFNNVIRKISNGVITTVAGGGTQLGDNGPATSAQLSSPLAVAVDSAGNLYIADYAHSRIRKVANGVITTVAGNGTQGYSGDNGPATAAELRTPLGVAVDSSGNLYFVDLNNSLRKVSNGVITTVSTGFDFPQGVAVDSAGNVYVADNGGFISKVANGALTVIAGGGITSFGDGGPATSAHLYNPQGLALDSAGKVYVADTVNNRIRLLTPSAMPTIDQEGVVPIYSAVPVIQPGSWVSIYGTNLASGTSLWNGNFPTSLGGTSVTIDNKLAYLWLVSPFQINLQAPDDAATGMVSVVVTTASGTATSTVTLAQYGPSFSLLGDEKHVAGEILTPNGTGAYGSYDLVGPSNTFSYSTRPVKVGETLVLFGVGFGPTTPHVLAGQAFSGSAPTNTPVTITIGGVQANVSYSGITEAGLYQFNLTVPPNTGSGDQPVQATVNGVQTPLGPVVTVQ
jgi:uncharacterized protein (TIGR03437 family)